MLSISPDFQEVTYHHQLKNKAESFASLYQQLIDIFKEETKKGAKFLFVGTKKQAQEAIQAEAARCGAYCIHEKWLGGTLTNFQTVKKSVERLNELEKWEASGVFKAISKKEASRLTKEMQRLQKLLGGIRDMKVLPDVVFVIDPVDTAGAVRESHTLGIPVVAVCDTNADPDMIDVPVPGNDDAARSIKLFCGAIADSILEARAEMEAVNKPAEAAEEGKPVENPVMAQAFESAMLAGEKAAQEAEAKAAEAPKAQEEEKAEEVKAEEPAEKKVKKAAAKKPAAKKTTAKTKKAAKAETEEVKAEEAPAEEAK